MLHAVDPATSPPWSSWIGAGTAPSTTTLDHDGNKNVIARTDAVNNGSGSLDIWSTFYDGFDRATVQEDPLGNTSESHYDAESHVIQRFQYGDDGNGMTKLLAKSQTNYDEPGRVFEAITFKFDAPGGASPTSYIGKTRFDRLSRVIASRNPRGNISSAIHDGVGRVVESTDPSGNTVETIYDDNSNVLQTKVSEVDGGSTQVYYTDMHYDAANRPILSFDTLGNTHRTYYDSRGNVVATTDSNSSGTVSVSTQARSGTVPSGNTDGNRIIYLHDGLSRNVEIIRELRTGHDGANGLAGNVTITGSTVINDSEIRTKTLYDDNSRVIEREDDKGNETTYGYDDHNRKTSESFEDGTSRSWTYDQDSHVTTWTDQRGVVATLSYDDLGRVTQAGYSYTGAAVVPVTGVTGTRANPKHAEGTTTQTFSYDGLSRVVQSTDNNSSGTADDSTIDCDFDSLSRCLSEAQTIGSSSGTVGKTYDANSNLTDISYPGNAGSLTVEYAYDTLDRVTTVDANSATTAEYTWFGPGRMKERSIVRGGTDIVTTLSYDNGPRITGISHDGLENLGTLTSMGFNYTYDRVGNVLVEEPTHESGSGSTAIAGVDYFNYDSAYRRTRESRGVYGTPSVTNNTAPNPNVTGTGSGEDQRDWKLDGVTNWREVLENGASSGPIRNVNMVNEYTDVAGVGRAHDANGNLVWDGTHLFYYDALNRLVRVERDDGSTRGDIAWYAWDTKGRRIRKFVNDTNQSGNTGFKEERVFFYLGQTVIEEEDILNSTADRQWVLGALGERFREYISNFTAIEKLDGSVAARADNNRDVQVAYDYRSQGLVTVWDPGSDGEFFTSDDGAQVAVDVTHATTHAIYLSQDRRFDLETGKYLGGAGTRFYDPENGRKLQPSADMWQSSLWGLRHNQSFWEGGKDWAERGREEEAAWREALVEKGRALDFICRPLNSPFAGLAQIVSSYAAVHCFVRLTEDINKTGAKSTIFSASYWSDNRSTLTGTSSTTRHSRLPHQYYDYQVMKGGQSKNLRSVLRTDARFAYFVDPGEDGVFSTFLNNPFPIDKSLAKHMTLLGTMKSSSCKNFPANAKELMAIKMKQLNALKVPYDNVPFGRGANSNSFALQLWLSVGCSFPSSGAGAHRIKDPVK